MSHPASIPPRPHRSREITATAVDAILKEVLAWSGNSEAEADSVRDLLISCADADAYQFARHLEDRYWDPDAELVGILDGYDEDAARKAAQKEWVRQHNIVVPFRVGDLVVHHTFNGDQTFRVVEIRPDTAHIVAQPTIPEPGAPDYGDTGGWIIPAEKARLAPAEEAAIA